MKVQGCADIADHTLEIVDLKEAEVTVIILDAFLLQLGALFRTQLVGFTEPFRPLRAPLVMREQRFGIVRTLAVGAAFHFHLEEAKIDAQLQFLAAIEAHDFANLDRAGSCDQSLTNEFKSRLLVPNDRTRDVPCQRPLHV